MKNKQLLSFVLFLLVAGLTAYFFHEIVPEEVDWIYYDGRVYSLDESNTVYGAIAVRGGVIRALGSTDEILSGYRATQAIDLSGNTILPGFIDSHVHLLSVGLARLTVNLDGTTSARDAAERVSARVRTSEEGTWIRGSGWDDSNYRDKALLNAATLDKVAGKNPVVLMRHDGGAVWVNSLVLSAAGITAGTRDPSEGRIVRGAGGRPSGVLVGRAMDPVMRLLPEPDDRERSHALELAFDECLRNGITTVHDMSVSRDVIRLYMRQNLPVRIYAVIDGHSDDWEAMKNEPPLIGSRGHRLTVRAVKFYVDGGLETRGAALIDAYSDDPGNRGITALGTEELRALTLDAVDRGYQVSVHAVGDRANAIALDAYESVIGERGDSDFRLRIEHAEVLLEEDIPRFAALGVIPCVQPVHCIDDMNWSESRLGHARMKRSYAWRSLRDAGSILPGGSDSPFNNRGPITGIYAAVTRRDLDGRPMTMQEAARYCSLSGDARADSAEFKGGWYVSQRIDRLEAVRMFTAWSAYAGFEEKSKGVLAPGTLADFVMLSDDIMEIDDGLIPSVKVLMTVVDGEPAYRVSRK